MIDTKIKKQEVQLCLKEWLINHPKSKINHFDDWIYLGSSYVDYLSLMKDFGKSNLMELFHRKISKKAEELRSEYIQYVSKVSQNNQSIYWHISETAENNTMCNNLFLDYCYLNICLDILKTNDKSLLVIIENKSLLESFAKVISKELKSNNQQRLLIIIPRKLSLYNLKESARNLIKHIRGIAGFLRKIIYRQVIIRSYLESSKHKNRFSDDSVLVYTFANDSCFQSDGIYKERYFGELIPKLKNSGKTIIYFLHATGYSKTKYRDIIKWINTSHDSFVLLEELITMKDVLISLFAPYLLLKTRIPLKNKNNMILFYLIKSELKNECLSGGLRTYYLYYTFIRNLSKNRYNIKYLLDIYEGHIIERVLRFSVKKHIPQCKTIGFSHSAFSKNHLSFFSSLTAHHLNLKPDYLLCTGNYYENIFINNGFSKENITIVGNLRQEFSEDWKYDPTSRSKRNSILVALPLLLNDAQELIWKIIRAFQNTDLEISIHKHPMMSLESLMVNEDELPENVRLKNEPTYQGMYKTDLVITTGSNMSINALKMGLPAISVIRTVGLTFEPLDWFDSQITYCSTPDEIRANSFRLLSLSKEDGFTLTRKGKNLANKCLESPNHKALEDFVSLLN